MTSIVSFGQSQAATGNIEGRVLDPQDAALPGVTVTATNQRLGWKKLLLPMVMGTTA
jgi:hypothetical protein